MKHCVLFVLIAVCLCGLLSAAEVSQEKDGRVYFQIENVRFYSCTLLGTENHLVAVGQRSSDEKGHKYQGYVAVLLNEAGKLTVVADDQFKVAQNDRKLPTRIRTVAAVNQPGGKNADIYITGKSGKDEDGIGFLRHYSWKNKKLSHTKTITLQQKQAGIDYTHGYSLKTGDIDGDGKQEAIYAGFYGKTINPALSKDFADVRIFKKNSAGVVEETTLKPFEKLKIPLRVNALEVKDINGDAKAEIIIAGRSLEGEREHSAFAIWSAGKVSYHVHREQTISTRFRTVMAQDIDKDGSFELITGGRLNVDKRTVADLQIWKLKPDGVSVMARYNWTSDASTRLRALAPATENNQFITAGRTELLQSGQSPRWTGFIRRFLFKNNSLWPIDTPYLMDKGFENRIRDIKFIAPNKYLASGFIMDNKKKNTGFVLIY
ncbi:MAG: hypothetical protein GY757_24925 [bacterium]|nr:hypothetical protein [bacterium]